MGYYHSDIVLCLSHNARRLLNVFIESLDTDRRELVVQFINLAQAYHRNGSVCFVWESVKWYDRVIPNMADENDLQIKASKSLKEFFCEIDEEDYLLIQMGEDDENVEKIGSFNNNPFNLSMKREIVINPRKRITVL